LALSSCILFFRRNNRIGFDIYESNAGVIIGILEEDSEESEETEETEEIRLFVGLLGLFGFFGILSLNQLFLPPAHA